jgi:polysaccharide export outer membrane protein
MIYFQGSGKIESAESAKYNSPLIRTDDLLAIHVTAQDPESALPFNPYAQNGTTQPTGYTNGIASQQGYLVDANGNIDFPVLGKVHLAGLTRIAATDLLKQQLESFLKAPLVNIRILNFKITVLGDVKNPGTFTIPNERITLPEALGLAGDLNITAVRSGIIVIRDVEGVKTTTRIDLTNTGVFTSPVYYLQQNDLVYVEPNRAQLNSSAINNRAGILISLASLVITTIVLIFK